MLTSKIKLDPKLIFLELILNFDLKFVHYKAELFFQLGPLLVSFVLLI